MSSEFKVHSVTSISVERDYYSPAEGRPAFHTLKFLIRTKEGAFATVLLFSDETLVIEGDIE